jgi:hypothetical protein
MMRFKKKRFSGMFITAVCFALVLCLTQTALAKRCWLDGNAYLGNAVPWGQFIITFQSGPWDDYGNLQLEGFLSDYTLFGAFPTAVSGTHAKGAWKRTGNRSFEYSWLAYAFDASGAVVYILKASGTLEMSYDCMKGTITANNRLYAPDQDPLGDEPPAYGCAPYPLPITIRLIEVGKVTCD